MPINKRTRNALTPEETEMLIDQRIRELEQEVECNVTNKEKQRLKSRTWLGRLFSFFSANRQ